jgi:hypothetical protein
MANSRSPKKVCELLETGSQSYGIKLRDKVESSPAASQYGKILDHLNAEIKGIQPPSLVQPLQAALKDIKEMQLDFQFSQMREGKLPDLKEIFTRASSALQGVIADDKKIDAKQADQARVFIKEKMAEARRENEKYFEKQAEEFKRHYDKEINDRHDRAHNNHLKVPIRFVLDPNSIELEEFKRRQEEEKQNGIALAGNQEFESKEAELRAYTDLEREGHFRIEGDNSDLRIHQYKNKEGEWCVKPVHLNPTWDGRKKYPSSKEYYYAMLKLKQIGCDIIEYKFTHIDITKQYSVDAQFNHIKKLIEYATLEGLKFELHDETLKNLSNTSCSKDLHKLLDDNHSKFKTRQTIEGKTLKKVDEKLSEKPEDVEEFHHEAKSELVKLHALKATENEVKAELKDAEDELKQLPQNATKEQKETAQKKVDDAKDKMDRIPTNDVVDEAEQKVNHLAPILKAKQDFQKAEIGLNMITALEECKSVSHDETKLGETNNTLESIIRQQDQKVRSAELELKIINEQIPPARDEDKNDAKEAAASARDELNEMITIYNAERELQAIAALEQARAIVADPDHKQEDDQALIQAENTLASLSKESAKKALDDAKKAGKADTSGEEKAVSDALLLQDRINVLHKLKEVQQAYQELNTLRNAQHKSPDFKVEEKAAERRFIEARIALRDEREAAVKRMADELYLKVQKEGKDEAKRYQDVLQVYEELKGQKQQVGTAAPHDGLDGLDCLIRVKKDIADLQGEVTQSVRGKKDDLNQKIDDVIDRKGSYEQEHKDTGREWATKGSEYKCTSAKEAIELIHESIDQITKASSDEHGENSRPLAFEHTIKETQPRIKKVENQLDQLEQAGANVTGLRDRLNAQNLVLLNMQEQAEQERKSSGLPRKPS